MRRRGGRAAAGQAARCPRAFEGEGFAATVGSLTLFPTSTRRRSRRMRIGEKHHQEWTSPQATILTNPLTRQVNENLDVPLRLNAIRVLGATQTRPSFLSRIFAPHLVSLPPPSFLSASYPPPSLSAEPTPQTLRSVLKTSQQVVDTLTAHDIFRTLSASIERPASVLAHPDEVDLVLRVTEAPKYFLRTATDVGDGEGSATATAKIRNALGGGETVEGNLSFGTRTRNAFQVRLLLPSLCPYFPLTFLTAGQVRHADPLLPDHPFRPNPLPSATRP
jgi:hypothetical protein